MSIPTLRHPHAPRGLLDDQAQYEPRLDHAVRERLERSFAALAGRLTPVHLRSEAVRQWLRSEGESQPETYREGYLIPVLRLLAACLEPGHRDWEAVYVDERLRVLAGARVEEREALLAVDEEGVTALCGEDDDLAAAIRRRLDELHAPLRGRDGEPVQLMMVGDCLMTEVRALARAHARDYGVRLTGRHVYFSAHQRASLDTDEVIKRLEQSKPDLLALSFLTFEGIPAYRALLERARRGRRSSVAADVEAILALVGRFVEDVRSVSPVTILLHGCCGLPLWRYRRRLPMVPAMSAVRRSAVAALDDGLRELAGATENAVFIDERAAAQGIGLRAAGSALLPSRLTSEAMFHSTRLGAALAPRYAELAWGRAVLRGTKVLLVDFDDTLWQGVIGEGEVIHDVGRQKLLRELREAGVLLVALSKNSPDSIRWEEMSLGPDDFVLHKVAWSQKAQSILEAAQQLDLHPDSFLLIDDSPAERELVRQRVPEVRSLDSAAPATWRALALLLELPETGRSAEAARRTEMYREAAARREALAQDLDLASMMGALELRAGFGPARERDLDRVHELLARTNQFNTTTRRRTEGELRALADSDRHQVLVATLADKFGALGLVGVVILERRGDEVDFDSVVMSCRAMGFGLEQLMLRGALDAAAPWREAVGRYVPTARNGPCAHLFANAGFQQRDDAEWTLHPTDPLPSPPDWLAVAPLER